MFSTELIAAIKGQVTLIYQAQSATQAVRIWTRSEDWKGSHKWFGRRFRDMESDSREILEFGMEYMKTPQIIPATAEVPCEASDLKDAYSKFLGWCEKIQTGYMEIQAMANAEDQTDVSDWFDHLVESGVDRIEGLNTDMKYLTRSGTEQAALELFDKKKK